MKLREDLKIISYSDNSFTSRVVALIRTRGVKQPLTSSWVLFPLSKSTQDPAPALQVKGIYSFYLYFTYPKVNF